MQRFWMLMDALAFALEADWQEQAYDYFSEMRAMREDPTTEDYAKWERPQFMKWLESMDVAPFIFNFANDEEMMLQLDFTNVIYR